MSRFMNATVVFVTVLMLTLTQLSAHAQTRPTPPTPSATVVQAAPKIQAMSESKFKDLLKAQDRDLKTKLLSHVQGTQDVSGNIQLPSQPAVTTRSFTITLKPESNPTWGGSLTDAVVINSSTGLPEHNVGFHLYADYIQTMIPSHSNFSSVITSTENITPEGGMWTGYNARFGTSEDYPLVAEKSTTDNSWTLKEDLNNFDQSYRLMFAKQTVSLPFNEMLTQTIELKPFGTAVLRGTAQWGTLIYKNFIVLIPDQPNYGFYWDDASGSWFKWQSDVGIVGPVTETPVQWPPVQTTPTQPTQPTQTPPAAYRISLPLVQR